MRKRKSSIIPVGDFDKTQEQERKEALEKATAEFYADPLIPWWFKLAHALSPVPLHKPDRPLKWCKLCGRKHSKRQECEHLRLVEDLTAPPTKVDEFRKPIPNRKVGFYTTRPEEAAVA